MARRTAGSAWCRAAGGLLAAALVLSGPGAALAQQGAVAVPAGAEGNLAESYDEVAKVSGAPMVGLRLGDPEGALDVDNVVIAGPPGAARTVCIGGTTRDGRYSALNPYRVEGEVEGAGGVRLAPLTARYREPLSRYDAQAFAVRAFVPSAAPCVPARALHLPQIVSHAGETAVLVVLANGRSRTATAGLFPVAAQADISAPAPPAPPPAPAPEAAPSVSAPCATVDGASRVAYDLVCRLPVRLGPHPSSVWLRLVFNDGFALDSYEYWVLLPAAAK